MNEKYEDPPEAHDLEGRYANYFKIGYNAFEFLLDFGQLYNGEGMAQIHTRIITSPVYVKAFLKLLHDSIDRYEQAFGAIGQEKGSGNEEANERRR